MTRDELIDKAAAEAEAKLQEAVDNSHSLSTLTYQNAAIILMLADARQRILGSS